jgi:hypothetical protein
VKARAKGASVEIAEAADCASGIRRRIPLHGWEALDTARCGSTLAFQVEGGVESDRVTVR